MGVAALWPQQLQRAAAGPTDHCFAAPLAAAGHRAAARPGRAVRLQPVSQLGDGCRPRPAAGGPWPASRGLATVAALALGGGLGLKRGLAGLRASEQEVAAPHSRDDLHPLAGAALLMVLAAFYGANAPLLKNAEDLAPLEITSTELVALRFLAAALPLLPWLLLNAGKAWRVLAPGVELGLWLWAAYTLQVLGLEKLPASTASVLFALCGLMVQGLELAFDRKPLSPATALSTLGAILGLGLFVTAPSPDVAKPGLLWLFADNVRQALAGLLAPPPAPHEALLKDVPGEALVLLATFFFAVHVWRAAALTPHAGNDKAPREDHDDTGHGLALGAVQLLVSAVAGVGFSLLDSSTSVAEQLGAVSRLHSDVWQCVLACGIVCTALPQTLELFALRVTPPAQAALIYCTIPVWGTALSVAFLGDPLTIQAIAGGALIVLCSMPWSAPEEAPSRATAGAPVTPEEELRALAGLVEPETQRQGLHCARWTEVPTAPQAKNHSHLV